LIIDVYFGFSLTSIGLFVVMLQRGQLTLG
jgi:hypothetical protein